MPRSLSAWVRLPGPSLARVRHQGLDTGTKPTSITSRSPARRRLLRAESKGCVEKSIQTVEAQVFRITRSRHCAAQPSLRPRQHECCGSNADGDRRPRQAREHADPSNRHGMSPCSPTKCPVNLTWGIVSRRIHRAPAHATSPPASSRSASSVTDRNHLAVRVRCLEAGRRALGGGRRVGGCRPERDRVRGG